MTRGAKLKRVPVSAPVRPTNVPDVAAPVNESNIISSVETAAAVPVLVKPGQPVVFTVVEFTAAQFAIAFRRDPHSKTWTTDASPNGSCWFGVRTAVGAVPVGVAVLVGVSVAVGVAVTPAVVTLAVGVDVFVGVGVTPVMVGVGAYVGPSTTDESKSAGQVT